MSTKKSVAKVDELPALTPNVPDLLALAIEKKVDVDILRGLTDLQERFMEREARTAYFEALAQFQQDCPPLTQSRAVDFVSKKGGRVRYTYTPLDEMVKTIRPVLHQHGLSFGWTVEQGERDNVLVVVCSVRHVLGHHEEARFPVPVDNGALMSPAQKNGAALTYGRRQSLVAVLGLVTADQDSDAASGEVETITPDQVKELNDRMTKLGAGKRFLEGFLQHMGVEQLDEITRAEFGRAIQTLDARLDKAAGR